MTKEELDLIIRKRKSELFDINEDIRKGNIKKSHLEHDTAEAQEEYNYIRKENKIIDVKLKDVQGEVKSILSEAKNSLNSAKARERLANGLVDEKRKDLATLRCNKEIYAKVKQQERDNIAKNKELDKELKSVVDKGKALNEAVLKQKDVDSLKESLKASEDKLAAVINQNILKGDEMDIQIAQSEKSQIELKTEILRHSQSAKEMEEKTKLLNDTIADKEYEITELERQKAANEESNRQSLAQIDARTQAVETKENKINRIIEKMKKNKKLTDDLKAVGLIKW